MQSLFLVLLVLVVLNGYVAMAEEAEMGVIGTMEDVVDDFDIETEVAETLTKVVLEHSLDMATFKRRGEFTLATDLDGNSRVVGLAEDGFAEADVAQLKGLLGKGELYRIRILSDPNDAKSEFVGAAIPACDLQKSGFKEDINLHMELSNNIVGIVYTSRAHSAIARACDPSKVPMQLKFQSRMKVLDIAVSQSVPVIVTGAKPPNLKNVNFGESDMEKPAEASQSFLRKYWYIVLPLVIFYFTGAGGAAPEDDKAKAGTPPPS